LENTKSDIEIIRSIIAGDKTAFKALYQRYARKHMLTCLRYAQSRADAEDLLQESYIKIYKDLHQFKPEKAKFGTWSNKVIVNTCLMKLRKKNIFTSIENVEEKTKDIQTKENALDKLSLKELTYLIAQLPDGYRTIFNMFVIDGYSHKEISELLNISINTSKTQLLKAKKTLQKKIKSREAIVPNSV